MTQTMSKSNRTKWVAMVLVIAVAAAAAQTPTAQPVERQILVSVPDRKLALIEDGHVLKIYPVAVGTDRSPSPDGEFKIVNRVDNPTYYRKGVVIPAGPENPLGNRWIGLSQPHYGIHGTNEPLSIGKAVSHGCIRMSMRDLDEFFNLVRIGDTVIIRHESDDETARIFRTADTNTILAQAQQAAAGGQ